MIKCRFYLVYNYGQHRVDVETNSYDFYKVIDELKKEFEIKVHNSEDLQDVTSYSLCNYYGDWEMIAYILEEVQ